ncbi:hypothetical protein E2C01_072249 [Portunus trituberculatus]|uniref:Uncharacterized protein n=1 Tax=Portunus trituberculatus TaxID=210409 RepID=A0A5B7I674_PORTR|nr:hypothetical protein [Portunus trituberculatus]
MVSFIASYPLLVCSSSPCFVVQEEKEEKGEEEEEEEEGTLFRAVAAVGASCTHISSTRGRGIGWSEARRVMRALSTPALPYPLNTRLCPPQMDNKGRDDLLGRSEERDVTRRDGERGGTGVGEGDGDSGRQLRGWGIGAGRKSEAGLPRGFKGSQGAGQVNIRGLVYLTDPHRSG